MAYQHGATYFQRRFRSHNGTPTSQVLYGFTVTPGVGAMGSWVNVITGAQLTFDCQMLVINVNGNAAASQNRASVLDIGVDPAGGTAYQSVIVGGPGILIGGAGFAYGYTCDGLTFRFPLRIKAGSSIAVRAQGGNAAYTFGATAGAFGQHTDPLYRSGTFIESIGVSGITGTAIDTTTSPSGSQGTLTNLPASTKQLFSYGLQVQVNSTTIANRQARFEISAGGVPIIESQHVQFITEVYGTSFGPVWNVNNIELPVGTVFAGQFAAHFTQSNCQFGLWGVGG